MEKELLNYYKSEGRRQPKVVVEDIEKLTQLEWLQTRQKGIGGSDSGAVYFGIGTYRTAFDVAISKLENITEVPANNAEKQYIFDYGHAIEACLGNYYRITQNAHVFYDRGMYYHPDYPHMLCDCDGFAITADGETIGLEFKSASPFYKDAWRSGIYGQGGEIAVKDYFCQVQHYMAVMDLDRYDIVVDFKAGNPNDIKIVTVYRDEEFIADLIAKEKEFWENRDEIPLPEVCDKEEIDTIAHKMCNLGLVVEDDTLAEVVSEMLEFKEQKSRLAKQTKEVEDRINAREATIRAVFEEKKADAIVFGENILEKYEKKTSRYDTKALKEMPELDKFKKESITIAYKLNNKKI